MIVTRRLTLIAATVALARAELCDRAAFADLGIDVGPLGRRGSRLGRACLDWSERRYHLAGPLGVALTSRLLELSWIERTPTPRVLSLTNAGRRAIKARFGVTLF